MNMREAFEAYQRQIGTPESMLHRKADYTTFTTQTDATHPACAVIQPRLIRATKAHIYLGMSRDLFDKEVRPHIKAAPLGRQGVVFDRLDLDRFADEYMSRNGRRPADEKGVTSWVERKKPASAFVAGSGTSTASGSADSMLRFTAALARVTLLKPSASRRK